MPIRCDLCNVITGGNPNHETGKRHKELKASRDKSSEVIGQKVSDCHPGPSVSQPNCHISPDSQPSPAVVQPVFCDLCNVSSSDQLSHKRGIGSPTLVANRRQWVCKDPGAA